MSASDVLIKGSSGTATGVPMWLQAEDGALYSVLHSSPEGVTPTNTAVLMLPTFGWGETCAYRGRRNWATELALAGFPTLRVDLPGTGESYGGPREPELVAAWLKAIDTSARWLRAATGCERLAVVGVGLGGLVAAQAVANGTAIEDLILWGVPARGRALVRELRVHAGVVDQNFLEDIEGHEPENGDIEMTGYLMTAGTVAALEAIRLDEAPLAAQGVQRVCLIERDKLPVDAKLKATYEAAGVPVTVQSASDFHILMEHPGVPGWPAETAARSVVWLQDGPTVRPGRHVDQATLSRETAVARFESDGRTVEESLIGWQAPHGALYGVLTEPVDGPRAPLCVVMLNAGALRKTGPTRMWVELSRYWAGRGVPVARIDVEGIGDSDGVPDEVLDAANLQAARRDTQAREILDHLQEAGVADRFVFVGLCSSAYWGVRAALTDSRVVGLLLMNLWSFEWSPAQHAEVFKEAAANVLRTGVVRRVMRNGISREDRRMAMEGFRSAVRREAKTLSAQETAQIGGSLNQLRDSNTRVLMLFSSTERLWAKLAALGFMPRLSEWPNLTVEELPTRDHDLRAPWLQDLIRQRLDSALEDIVSAQG